MSLLFLAFGVVQTALAKPPLWKLQDEDTTIYLFGTFHLLKKDTLWYTHEIDDALKASDALYIEITLRELDSIETWDYIRSRGFFPDGTYLTDYISDQEFYKLQELISKAGGNSSIVFRMKPMMAAGVLEGAPYADEDLKRLYGAEETLIRRAGKFNVPVKGLTSLETHLGAGFDYSVQTQVRFLRETIKEAQKESENIDYYINAWIKGDLEAINIDQDGFYEKFPGIVEKLLYDRNQLWVDQIVKMMDRPGQIFIAVGAGHFSGRKNVIELLEKEGLHPVRQ